MFCPVCQAEYPQEVARCSICNVGLVDASPKKLADDSPSDGNLLLLWSGDDLALHESLLEELKAQGVPYFNRPIGNYSYRAFPNRFPRSGATPFGFEVSVLSSDFEKAKTVLERVARSS